MPYYTKDWSDLKKAVEVAWGIIANAHGGNWDLATPEWRQAAERWRDENRDVLVGEDERGS